jgi:hypothetical protein
MAQLVLWETAKEGNAKMPQDAPQRRWLCWTITSANRLASGGELPKEKPPRKVAPMSERKRSVILSDTSHVKAAC